VGVTYDTGALLKAEIDERRVWARHRELLAARQVPSVPAPVVAQAWRGGARQARLARFLSGCDVETLDDGAARRTGALLGAAGASDIVDAFVVEGALRRRDVVVTSDRPDIEMLADALGRRLEIEDV
jgi:predicted nucleic acid-binding protein